MALFRTVDPAAEPVTLVEVKAHLRLQHSDDDTLLDGLVRAARHDVEQRTGLALIDQHWRLARDAPLRLRRLALKRHPVTAVTSVTVYDSEGAAQLVDPADYRVLLQGRPAQVEFVRPPAHQSMANGIEIDFTAGFGASSADVPDGLKRAILVLVAHWYEFRAGYGPAEQPVSWPAGYDRLVASWKEGRL